MAQQWNDLVYRYPAGQGPQLGNKLGNFGAGIANSIGMGSAISGSARGGKGLLSDPGQFQKLQPGRIQQPRQMPNGGQPWAQQQPPQMQPKPMQPQTGGPSFGEMQTGGGSFAGPMHTLEGRGRADWAPMGGFNQAGQNIAGNARPMPYNPPNQAAPQAPSPQMQQRDPNAVAARQAQRQQYLKRMGR